MKDRNKHFSLLTPVLSTILLAGCVDIDLRFDPRDKAINYTVTPPADIYVIPAGEITDSTAIIMGAVKPNNDVLTVSFNYFIGDMMSDSMVVDAIPHLITGVEWEPVSAKITGLPPATTILYYISTEGTIPVKSAVSAFATSRPADQLFEGGIKFYTDSTGQHGLIAAPNDLVSYVTWGNYSEILTGASGTKIGTGHTNTNSIVFSLGEGPYAARFCEQMVLNGYDDWFLPSKDELNLMYEQRKLIGGFNPFLTYVSSSEVTNEVVWTQLFRDGSQVLNYKNLENFSVRPIRAF